MAGRDGFGVKLDREATPGMEDFEPVGSMTNLSGPGTSREEIDVTTHDSPDGWREFIFGLKDGGEVSADINYDPVMHDPLQEDYEYSDPRRYRVTFPDPAATTWTFQAGLTGFEPEAPHDDKLAASLTWKVSGKPTLSSLEA